MKLIFSKIFLIITLFLMIMQFVMGANNDRGIKVGVSSVTITPHNYDELHNVWGTKFKSIHDSLYVKCLIIDKVTHQARSTKIKRGYVEKGFVDMFLNMNNQDR